MTHLLHEAGVGATPVSNARVPYGTADVSFGVFVIVEVVYGDALPVRPLHGARVS